MALRAAFREVTLVGMLGLLGLALRLVYVWQFTSHPLGRVPWVDEGAYWTRAATIVAGAWLPDRPFYQDPLYPYLLALLMRLAGTEVPHLRIVLACLGALTPIAVYAAGRLGLGRAEGMVAGLGAAVFGPLVFTDGLLEKESLGALVAAVALALMAWAAAPRARAWRALAPGLSWGILALLRANALVLAPLGVLWWSRAGGGTRSRGQRGLRALLFLIAFLVAIVPATLVNAMASRPAELILTTWQAGANFYIGNGPEANGTYAAPAFVEANPAHEADDFLAEAERRTGRRLTYAQVSRFWLAEGLNQWRRSPGTSLRLLVHKLELVLHNFEIPDNQDPELVAVVAAPSLWWAFLSFGAVVPLAVVGLAQRDAWRATFLGWLNLSTVAGLATTACFFVVGRYRIPWMPGLFLLAASGLMQIVRLGARGSWGGVAWRVGLLAVPAAALAWRALPDPVPERWGHAEIDVALAYLADGRLEPAIDALDDARAVGSGPAGRVASLLAEGPAHEQLAWLIQLRRSASVRSRPILALDQARWLRQFPGSRASARDLLEGLLRDHPDDPQVLREWAAWWLGETGDAAARSKAEAALSRAGGDVSSAILLALVRSEPRPLDRLNLAHTDRRRERVRLARAIISHRHRLVR